MFGEFTLLRNEVWQMNASAKGLLIVTTDLDSYSLVNCRQFSKFAKLSTLQTFLPNGICVSLLRTSQLSRLWCDSHTFTSTFTLMHPKHIFSLLRLQKTQGSSLHSQQSQTYLKTVFNLMHGRLIYNSLVKTKYGRMQKKIPPQLGCGSMAHAQAHVGWGSSHRCAGIFSALKSFK